jgi:hypothetical protein
MAEIHGRSQNKEGNLESVFLELTLEQRSGEGAALAGC